MAKVALPRLKLVVETVTGLFVVAVIAVQNHPEQRLLRLNNER
jgi:hypothetical protein